MSKVVTFGEIMLRLAPEGHYRIIQADRYEATYGGAEANVAVALSNLGEQALFVTKLPDNPVGQAGINALRRYGVDTSMIVRGGDRVGVYFMERGASQRGSLVVYDRAHSSIAEASTDDFDWNAVFDGADWFHFTGITPAVSKNAAALCLKACRTAKERGITVSCDLNYRKKLWTRDEAREMMGKLCEYVDVCIANEEDAADVFGICAPDTSITGGKLSRDGYKYVAKELCDRFGFKTVAITLRSSVSASDNGWAAMLYEGGEYYFSKEYAIHIVDRVGGGDSFGAGLIYGALSGYGPQEKLEFAVAASCLQQTIEGDFNCVTLAEVKKLAGGDGSGRVSR